MPGPIFQVYELNDGTIPPDQQVGRHLKARNCLEIGVFGRVKAVAEKPLNLVATKLPRGKADIVNNQEGNSGTAWPIAVVR